MAWCLVDSNNVVQNIISYDGTSAYMPPDGLTLSEIPDGVQINATYINGVVTNPTPPAVEIITPPQPTLADLQAQLADLTFQINKLVSQGT